MKIKTMTVIMIIFIAFSACGQNDNNDAVELESRILTILIRDNWHIGVIEQAVIAMNESWQAQGLPYIFEVEVDTSDFGDTNWIESRMGRLGVELMAGQGSDMFISGFSNDIRSVVRSGLLADMYTLMDNCPNTNRDDFFTNVLSAFEIDGGLYTFPLSFGFHYVGINTALPQVFIERFNQESTVTIRQMLGIYLDVKEQQEFAHLFLGTPTSINSRYTMIENTMHNFIDFNSRTSNIMDDDFISYLDLISRVFRRNENLPRDGTSSSPFIPSNVLRNLQDRRIFFTDSSMLSPVHAFLGDGEYFAWYSPLADESGRLFIDNSMLSNSVWASFSITSAGQQELAWEFIQHLIKAYSQPTESASVDPIWGTPLQIGSFSFSTPIKRSLADEHLRRVFENILEINDLFVERDVEAGFANFITPQEQAKQIEAAISRINAYNEMPMATLSPQLPWSLFVGSHGTNVSNFMSGAITAETYAQLTHNAVSLWLIE